MCKKCTRPCTQDAQDCDCRQDAQYFAQSAQEYAWMHNLQHFVKCGDISFFRRAHNVSTSQVHRQLNCFAHILARNSIKPTKDGLHALHSERKRRKPCTSLTAAQPRLNQGLNQGGLHTMHIAHCTGQDSGETAWQRTSQDALRHRYPSIFQPDARIDKSLPLIGRYRRVLQVAEQHGTAHHRVHHCDGAQRITA